MVLIREFRVADRATAARVVELQQAAYAIEAELIGFAGIPPLHDTAKDVMGYELVWVGAFAGDRLVGGLGYVDDVGHRDIDRLFVEPARSRQGIGRALVDSVLDKPEVRVATGTANLPAIALYQALGFVAGSQREIAPGVTVTEFTLRR